VKERNGIEIDSTTSAAFLAFDGFCKESNNKQRITMKDF
jgi:hypothetical protein